ncbi:MAG: M24 family metallopeptidase [Phycisphaerales bacterium]
MSLLARKSKMSLAEVDLAYTAAQKVVEVHRHLSAFLRVGMTLAQVDAEAARFMGTIGVTSCFFRYSPKGHTPKLPPFPSHTCLSLNECVVHGHVGYPANDTKLKPGDLFKIDVGVFYKGWVGDAAWTYSLGEPTAHNRRLMECGKQALARGIPTLRPGAMWIDWAREVQTCVETEYGLKCVRGLGGHGIGLKNLHGPPFVSNVVPGFDQEWREAYHRIQPGTLVAVEPMVAVGTGTHVDGGKHFPWPQISGDRSMTVHYEADVLVTENGPRDLTEGMTGLPDVVG